MTPRTVRRVLVSVLVVGMVGLVAGAGTYAAFSSTTMNQANSFAAGTVKISDNDAGSAMLSLSGANPGATSQGCIQVTSSGTLASQVRLYASTSGSLAPYLNLTVTRGSDPTPSFSSCGGFSNDGANYIGAGPGVVYSGTLSAYPGTWGGGVVDPSTWNNGEAHSYRFQITAASTSAIEGLSSTASFTWEARNI